MGKVGSFIHNSEYSSVATAATTTFDVARSLEIDLWKDSPGVLGDTRSVAHLSGLFVTVDNIAGACTKLTIRLCRDSDGDISVIGDTEADLTVGVTDPTVGTVSFKIDVDYVYQSSKYLYLFWKTDADTCDVQNVSLTWSE